MNSLDIILTIIVVAGFIVGYRKGVINQVGDMAAILLGVVACRFMPGRAAAISGMLSSRMPDHTSPWLIHTAGYILLFVAVYLTVKIVARLLRTATHAAMLGPVDRLCGSAFMIAKCLLALSIVLNVSTFLSPQNSITAGCHPRIKPLQEMVVAFAPRLLGVCADHADMLLPSRLADSPESTPDAD